MTTVGAEHGDRLEGAARRLRQALVDAPLPLPGSVLASALGGLGERLSFFGQAMPEPAPPWADALADRVVAQWLTSTATLWRRLAEDRDALRAAFGLDAGTVDAVATCLGDPHRGGDAVARIDLGGGALFYKPRPVALERFFGEVFGWVGAGRLDVLDRGGHGWVRAVEARPCASPGELGRFHERLGALLALGVVFAATDLHEDNLVASGEHPVLVDLETMASPVVGRFDGDDRLAPSVLDLGLLPAFLPDEHGRLRLSGGIGGGLTDPAPTNNLPRLGGEPVLPFAYADDVASGFRAAWRCLADRRDELGARVREIAGASYRLVLRPTEPTWAVLRRVVATTDVRDERAFRLALARGLGLRPELPRPDAVLEAELAFLTALEIPWFGGKLGSREVFAAGSDRPLFEVAASPLEALAERLEQMRPEDDERHVAQIRAAFVAADRAAAPASGPAAPSAIAAASAIADELARAAVATREGGVDWLLPREADGRWQLARVDLGLVHGRAGIGLFFAAAARVTGEPRYRELARLSFRWQAASLPLAEAPLAHGDGSGPGSLVYALTVAGELLEDTALVADAKSWRALLEPSPRAPFDEVALLRALAETTDDHSDALGDGAAGRADAALELAQRSGDAAWAARARAHADALVARSGGYRIPLAPGCQRPGLFDGLAGIGYALLRQVDPSLPCVLFWEAER